jgi:pullulanase/glycogen debranching enzyme
MKLYEFFGKIDLNQDEKKDSKALNKEEEQELEDQLFWFILDDNDLHKKYFMPIAKELKRIYKSDSKTDDLHDWKTWIPMVKAGCVKFYKENDVKKRIEDTFPKELRASVCKRLTDHYYKDIINDQYNVGE